MRVMFYNLDGNLEVAEIESIWFNKEDCELRILTKRGTAFTTGTVSYKDKMDIDYTMSRILKNGFLDLTKYGRFYRYIGFNGN